MYDLTYLTTGLFTVFFPETKDGEYAFKTMCEELGNNSAKILTRDLKSTLKQLRKAGYTVGKAKPVKHLSIDDILDSDLAKELGI